MVVVDFSCTGFMAAGRVCHMNVTELVAVGADIVAQASFVELHMINIVKDLQHGRTDQSGQFCCHAGGSEKIALVVSGNVQWLQIQQALDSSANFAPSLQIIETWCRVLRCC